MLTSTAPNPTHRSARRWLVALVVGVAFAIGSLASAPAAHADVRSLAVVQKPIIVGLPVVGNQLTATSGDWKGASPLFYSFAWRSPTKSLLSSTSTYTPTTSDIGQVLTVRVTVQDGDNNSSFIDVSTPAIVASDVVNTVQPKFTSGMTVGDTVRVSKGTFTSGSGALTYTYAWSTTDGQTSSPLPDKGPTHLITKADLGFYLSVVVTATSPTQKGSVTVRTAGAVIPAIPFASDAGMTSSNRGRLTVRTSKSIATISDPAGTKNDGVFVYAYSKAAILGWFALDSHKQFSVNYQGLAAGQHKLAVIDQSGKLVGWVAVTRAAEPTPIFAAANAPIGIAAAVFVAVAIAGFIVLGRARRRRRRRH